MRSTHVRRPIGRLAGASVLGLGLLAMVAMSSLAVFTDQEQITGNQFTVGSVNLTLSNNSQLVSFTSPAMVPGDTVTAPLTVTNAGSMALRYAVTSTTTENPLAAALVLTVKVGVTTCNNASWQSTGTVLYQGALGTTTGSAVFGNPAQGAQAGDRALAVATNEVLCLNVTLPLGASTTVQGLTTTATFTFDAEQTTNNP
jgi:spore coat-associated protein N